jgi:hypothetical protein
VKTALALVGVAVLAACSSSNSAKPATNTAPSGSAGSQATDAPTTTTASTLPLRAALKTGESTHTDKGFAVEVLGYTAPVTADDASVKPPSGQVFAVVEVKACSGDQEAKSPGPAEFALQLADGSSAQPRVSVRKPAYLIATLKPTECTQGFISFTVPNGARPSRVVLTTDGSNWTVG